MRASVCVCVLVAAAGLRTRVGLRGPGPPEIREDLLTTSLDIQHGGDIFVGAQLDQDNVVEVTLKCQNVFFMQSLLISSEDYDYVSQLLSVQRSESEKVDFIFEKKQKLDQESKSLQRQQQPVTQRKAEK